MRKKLLIAFLISTSLLGTTACANIDLGNLGDGSVSPGAGDNSEAGKDKPAADNMVKVAAKINPSLETNDLVVAEVMRLEKEGVLSDVLVAESFPVQISATGPADVIQKLQDLAAGKIMADEQPSEDTNASVTEAINPSAETNEAVLAEVKRLQIEGVIFDVAVRESFPVQITASGPAEIIKKLQALAAGESMEETGMVAFETLAQVAISGVDDVEAQNLVITDSAAFDALWKRHKGGSDDSAPAVDFKTESVIAVFMGEKFTGGYQVEITAIHETDGMLTVDYTETEPAEDGFTAQVITYPVHLVKVAKAGVKEVKFNKTVVQMPSEGESESGEIGIGL